MRMSCGMDVRVVSGLSAPPWPPMPRRGRGVRR